MNILSGEQWIDGFLDYSRSSEEYRIQVSAWCTLEQLEGVYFTRPKNLRLVWNYIRDIGPIHVARKILSRSREARRNEKFVSCGIGVVLEAPDNAKYPVGTVVRFLAPCHPRCVERIVLPEELLRPDQHVAVAEPGIILYRDFSLPADEEAAVPHWWREFAGWSPFAGIELDPHQIEPVLEQVRDTIQLVPWSEARRLPVDGRSQVQTRRGSLGGRLVRSRRKRAVLFGYGNYAKTQVLPNIERHLDVIRIHEIDPTQVPIEAVEGQTWDTAPWPDPDDDFDALLIAGYHHTHAPLAVEALRRGAYAVVEKPVAIDVEQLNALLDALGESSRLFACFHKRYSPLNALAVEDLGTRYGDPISYHCIVYEVPLPELHWYRWPNSKSRLVSNGCHWVDHFLYLNDFAEPVWSDVAVAGNGTINCSIQLENGAFFSMVLTDQGSERIGVQDYIELRTDTTTIRMVNGSSYRAEGPDRVMRRAKVNKMRGYADMYRAIGRAIDRGAPGDSRRSIEVSTRTVLQLEEQLARIVPTDRWQKVALS